MSIPFGLKSLHIKERTLKKENPKKKENFYTFARRKNRGRNTSEKTH